MASPLSLFGSKGLISFLLVKHCSSDRCSSFGKVSRKLGLPGSVNLLARAISPKFNLGKLIN